MKRLVSIRRLIVGSVLVLGYGCAHTGPDPFVYGPANLDRGRATPPACFTAPLDGCVRDPSQRDPVARLASPWNEPFQPDVAHRICRGDPTARQRWIEGARRLAESDPREPVYLQLLGECAEPSHCTWALTFADSDAEPLVVRHLLLESARRWCTDVVARDELERVGAELARTLSEEHPWVVSSQEVRCAEVSRHEDPWQDLAGVHAAGCLDLGDWITRHRETPDAAADALERCVTGREIRYREASCLRELAGLDRERAVDLVRSDDRRGWGMSSDITPYARTLLRYPRAGQLEAELVALGLVHAGSPPTVPGHMPVLPEEVLEHRGRLAGFSPACAGRRCEHAPLMYELLDLVSPVLDDVVLDERWPLLESVDLGDGPRAVGTSIHDIPVTLHVDETDGGDIDREQHDRLREEIERALEQGHELIVYADRRAYRLEIRNLAGWYDLETLLAGLNTLLADRGSDLRYVTLDPHCIPCARVVAGPGGGLVDAAFAGLIEVADPFKRLWTVRDFDPERLERGAGVQSPE